MATYSGPWANGSVHSYCFLMDNNVCHFNHTTDAKSCSTIPVRVASGLEVTYEGATYYVGGSVEPKKYSIMMAIIGYFWREDAKPQKYPITAILRHPFEYRRGLTKGAPVARIETETEVPIINDTFGSIELTLDPGTRLVSTDPAKTVILQSQTKFVLDIQE